MPSLTSSSFAILSSPIANCRETFLGSSAAVQQESEGAPALISNAKEVSYRSTASLSLRSTA